MRSTNAKRSFIILIATLLAISVFGLAQNTQAPPNQQPQQKESLWQKLKNSAKQTGQSTVQQGTQQVQQGTQQVQQGAQQMQQQVQQQIPGAAGQNNAAPQPPCGSLTGANGGGNPINAGNNGTAGGGSCGPQCFNAGPFAAAVTQMTMSQQGSWHVVRMNIQFKNMTDQPLSIAYHEGSMVMVDNFGNTYIPAGGSAGAVQGLGIDRGNQTESQFVLAPGQSGNAMFAVARIRDNQSAVGTGYTYNFTIDELQAQNGAEAIAVRQYNMNFPDLAPGATSAGFGGAGSSPAGSPVTNVAGRGKGTGRPVAGSSYVGGTAAAPVGTGVAVTRGATGSTATTIAPNGKGAAIGRAASAPAGVGVASPVRTTAVAAPAVAATPAQKTVNNAALRSGPATAVKPTPAAQPIPTRPPAKKTTATPATAATR
jgi:hypothetical protein